MEFEFIETSAEGICGPRYNESSGTNFFRVMARKSNPEKEMAVSGAAPAKSRRPATATGSRHSAPAGQTPVTSTEIAETETAVGVSAAHSAVLKTGDEAGPSREQIARLAYTYWLNRGCQEGSAEEDWLRAEQELRLGHEVDRAAVS
jgi:hypothetical protein